MRNKNKINTFPRFIKDRRVVKLSILMFEWIVLIIHKTTLISCKSSYNICKSLFISWSRSYQNIRMLKLTRVCLSLNIGSIWYLRIIWWYFSLINSCFLFKRICSLMIVHLSTTLCRIVMYTALRWCIDIVILK